MNLRLLWIVVIGFTASVAAPASAQMTAAEALYWEAVARHADGKLDTASEIMTAAAKLAPGNQAYQEYAKELVALLARRKLDDHALAPSAETENSIETLAKYLVQPARNDEEKARLIFRWMTDRIAYDADSFFAGKTLHTSAEGVLRTRKSICDGYANLFEALAKAAGLEVLKVTGYAKGYGYQPGSPVKDLRHAWNALKLDGRWRMIDSTWGAGHLKGAKFVKQLDNYYYLVPPEQFIYSHLPVDENHQFLPTPITLEQFEGWPQVDSRLTTIGFNPDDIRTLMERNDKPVQAYDYPAARIKVVKAPLSARLNADEEVSFRVEAPGALELAAINGDDFKHATQSGVFDVSFAPKKGTLAISARLPGKGDGFWPILFYKVE